MFNDNADYTYENWINQFRTINKLSEQLRFVITIIYTLDADGQDRFHDQLIKFEKIWQNQNQMRKVHHRDAMIEEYSAEYYGEDFGEDDVFRYDVDTERYIMQISLELMATLGMIIKFKREEDMGIDDEV